MEEKILQDLCRDAKSRLNMTNQDIADVSGVPISTVKNFFASSSKSPSVYTVAPICSALGVSIDTALNIVGAAAPQEIYERDLRVAYLEGRLTQLKDYATDVTKQMKRQRKSTIALSIICAVLMAVVIGYVSFDASVRNAGLIQNGSVSVYVVILFGVMLLALAIMGKLMVGIIRDFSPPPPCIKGDNGENK